jgi:hypothetical protein
MSMYLVATASPKNAAAQSQISKLADTAGGNRGAGIACTELLSRQKLFFGTPLERASGFSKSSCRQGLKGLTVQGHRAFRRDELSYCSNGGCGYENL